MRYCNGYNNIGCILYLACGDGELAINESTEGYNLIVSRNLIGDAVESVSVNVIGKIDFLVIVRNDAEGLVRVCNLLNRSCGKCKTCLCKSHSSSVNYFLINCCIIKERLCCIKFCEISVKGIKSVVTLLGNFECKLCKKSVLVCKEIFCESCSFGKCILRCIVGVKLVEEYNAPALGCVVMNYKSYFLTLKGSKIYLIGYKVCKEYCVAEQLALCLKICHVRGNISKLCIAVKRKHLAVLIFNSDINVVISCTTEHISSKVTIYDEVGGCKGTLRTFSSTVCIRGEVLTYIEHREILCVRPEMSLFINAGERSLALGTYQDPTVKAKFKATVYNAVFTGILKAKLVGIFKSLFLTVYCASNCYDKGLVNCLLGIAAEIKCVGGAVKNKLFTIAFYRICKCKIADVIYVFREIDKKGFFVAESYHIIFVSNLFGTQNGSYVVGNLHCKLNRELCYVVIVNIDEYLYVSFSNYFACGNSELSVSNFAECNRFIICLKLIGNIA